MLRVVLMMMLSTAPMFAPVAQDTCAVTYADLPFETATHLRGRDERMRNLIEIMDAVGGDDIADDVYELMYWAAMADSARIRADEAGNIDYPDCEPYKTLDTVFQQTINHAYALSVQTTLLMQGGLSDFQIENVSTLLDNQITLTVVSTEIWTALYDDLET